MEDRGKAGYVCTHSVGVAPTSLSQDSYDFPVSLPASRPTLESSVSVEYGLSSQAEGRDEADGSGMSRSLDRKLL